MCVCDPGREEDLGRRLPPAASPSVRDQPGWIAVQLGAPVGGCRDKRVVARDVGAARGLGGVAPQTPAFQETREALEAAEGGDHSETWHEIVLDDHR